MLIAVISRGKEQQQLLRLASEENISGLVFSKCIIHANITDEGEDKK